jgi:hypothetical protein
VQERVGEDLVLQDARVVPQPDEVLEWAEAAPPVRRELHRLDDRPHDEEQEQHQPRPDEEEHLEGRPHGPASPRGARGLIGTPGGEGFVEATLGETYALRTLSDRGLLDAAAVAAEALQERFRTSDPAGWREPRTTIEASPLGLAQAPEIGLINRGSWEQLVELGP